MSRSATTDPTYLQTIESWCRSQPEVLAEVRIRGGAGSKEFRLFSSYNSLPELIQLSPAGACISVFREPKLPLRGVVDECFIVECLKTIPDGTEYLMFETVPTVAGKGTWYHYDSGASHPGLREDLEQSLGLPVAVGFYPSPFAGPSEVVDGIVADADGVVRAGPY